MMFTKKIKVAINGFGRIGRTFFRNAFGDPKLDFIAINDLGSPEQLAYLLTYDSVYGKYQKLVEVKNGSLVVDGKEVKVFSEREPEKLPWKDLNIDVVVESTGVFTTPEGAGKHLTAGAKRVVISAKAKEESENEIVHFTPGTEEEHRTELRNNKITSDTSCTTNAVVPLLSVLAVNPGILKAQLITAHGYTASQNLVDGSRHDFRRGRAAGINIVPSTTSAAVAAARALPGFKNKFDGVALRVPVISGSIIDLTFVAGRKTNAEEINNILKKASEEKRWKDILAVTSEPLVSSDILGSNFGSIVDLSFTRVVDGDLVKVLSWYDNEWGYAHTLKKHVLSLADLLQ